MIRKVHCFHLYLLNIWHTCFRQTNLAVRHYSGDLLKTQCDLDKLIKDEYIIFSLCFFKLFKAPGTGEM